MEGRVDEHNTVSKRHKRKTVLSKLAANNSEVERQASLEEQLQLAKDLERQNLNGSYNSTGLSALKESSAAAASKSHRGEDRGSNGRKKVPPHPRRHDLEAKAEKRSRDSNMDSSDSDIGSSKHHVAKRHSQSKLVDSDRHDASSSLMHHQVAKDFGLNVNNDNIRMDTDSELSDDVRKGNHISSYRNSSRNRKSDEVEDEEEEKDFVPELNQNYSTKNSNLQPVMANSADFKSQTRSDWTLSFETTTLSETGGSDRSFGSTSALSLLTTEKARQRSFLVGSCSLLGSEALERFFPERKMRIFVGTWNMCEMKTIPTSINDFLLPELSEYVQDAYVIGTQETASNRQEWELKLQETLGPQYVMFHSSLYGTLHLAIFLRRDLIWFCSVSEEAVVTTRPGPSSIKTKGAVAICFTFFGTSFLFINSHFTAHDGRSEERVEDYKKIISSLSLPKIVNSKTYSKAADEDVSSRFECVFWLGDLNVRLERERIHLESVIASLRPDAGLKMKETLDLETEVMKSADLISYEDLLQHDELRRIKDQELAFQAFQEGRIKFLPTYKYDIGTDDFDTSKKNRIPSYTDRILFRSRQKNGISCLLYQSAFTIRDSDHKPVYGLYEVSVRPGMDNIPLSGGQFNREVWIEGNKRRAMRMTQRVSTKSNSSVCSLM